MGVVDATLSVVAIATAFARDWLLNFIEDHGKSTALIVRSLDVLTGLLLLGGGVARMHG